MQIAKVLGKIQAGSEHLGSQWRSITQQLSIELKDLLVKISDYYWIVIQ